MSDELEKAKSLYLKLKSDDRSFLFSEDNLTNNLVKKSKKSNSKKDNEFVKLVLKLEDKLIYLKRRMFISRLRPSLLSKKVR